MNPSSPDSALISVVASPSASPVVFRGTMGQVFVPVLIERAGAHARRRWTEFFAASLANVNISLVYGRAISRFLAWCEGHGLALEQIDTTTVGAYVKTLPGSSATARQALAAIRVFFNWDGHRRRAPRQPRRGRACPQRGNPPGQDAGALRRGRPPAPGRHRSAQPGGTA